MVILKDIQLINSEGQISWGYVTFAASMALFAGAFVLTTAVLIVRKQRSRR